MTEGRNRRLKGERGTDDEDRISERGGYCKGDQGRG